MPKAHAYECAVTTYPVMMDAAIAEICPEKFIMPPTVPTLPRGAISDGIDHPIGDAAESPPIDMLIQISARAAVCAFAAPRIPRPNTVPHTSTACRTRLAFRPRLISASTSHPADKPVSVANSHGTPVYRNEARKSMFSAEE